MKTRENSRECHKCKFDGKGDARCIKCPGAAEVAYKGVDYVHLGALEAPDEFIEANALERNATSDESGGVTEGLTEETERALVVILATFMAMKKIDLWIFHEMYHGKDMAQIGREMGLTKEGVRKHVINMAKANPKLMMAFGAMRRKGIGGAKKMRRELEQGELF